MVDPVVAVKTLLLQTRVPDVQLRPGTSVVARGLSRGEQHGVLVIAGIPLTAELPKEVGKTGETLCLSVADVTPERVELKLEQVVAPPLHGWAGQNPHEPRAAYRSRSSLAPCARAARSAAASP